MKSQSLLFSFLSHHPLSRLRISYLPFYYSSSIVPIRQSFVSHHHHRHHRNNKSILKFVSSSSSSSSSRPSFFRQRCCVSLLLLNHINNANGGGAISSTSSFSTSLALFSSQSNNNKKKKKRKRLLLSSSSTPPLPDATESNLHPDAIVHDNITSSLSPLTRRRRRKLHVKETDSLSSSSNNNVNDTVTDTTTTISPIISLSPIINYSDDSIMYQQWKELVQMIQYHDQLYYTPGLQPILSDEEYDALIRRETDLRTKYPSFISRLQKDIDFIPSTHGIHHWSTSSSTSSSSSSSSSSSIIYNNPKDNYYESNNNDCKNRTTATARTTINTMNRSNRIIEVDTEMKRVQHLLHAPMQSLDNAMNPTQVIQWITRIQKKLYSFFIQEVEEEEKKKLQIVLQLRAEPKLDGLSVSLRYQKRQEVKEHFHNNNNNNNNSSFYTLVWGATRGNGQYGEDVTHAVLAMTYLPSSSSSSPYSPNTKEETIHNHHKINNNNNNNDTNPTIITTPTHRIGKIPYSFHLPSSSSTFHDVSPDIIEIRGEVILPTFIFHTLNQQQQQQKTTTTSSTTTTYTFSNARNAASGILLRDKENPTMEEIKETQQLRSYLRFYAYGLVMSQEKVSSSSSEEEENVSSSSSEEEDTTIIGRQRKTVSSSLDKLEDIYTPLIAMGFTIPTPHKLISLTLHPNQTVTEEDCKELFQYHSSISTLYSRSSSSNNKNKEENFSSELDIDGAVYKVSNPFYCSILGSSTRAPKWAIAHKYPPTCGMTQLLNIEIQVGRTGVLTPVAILSPIDIAGAVIRRATLHNFIQATKILQPNKEGYILRGTHVMICRAGDVIPQVIQRIHGVTSTITTSLSIEGGEEEEEKEESWISLIPPKTCPSCGSQVVFESSNPSKEVNVQEDKEEESGPIIRCGGSPFLCKPRAVSVLNHAYSRSGFNIQGISEARVQQLVDANLLRYPVDVFRILDPNDTFTTNVSQLEGWGERSTRKLAQQVASVQKNGIELYQFIYSLGIRHVGLSSSKLVASTFGSATHFFDALKEKSGLYDSLIAVHGLGPKTLSSLVSFSEDDELIMAARNLADAIPIKDDVSFSTASIQSITQESLPLQGMNVVFTGSLGTNITRTKAQELAVTLLGARSTSNTLSTSTDLLVVGEKSGGKEKKAMEMNIKIMTGDEFLRLIHT